MKRLLSFGILMSLVIHSAGASVLYVFSTGFDFRSEKHNSAGTQTFNVEVHTVEVPTAEELSSAHVPNIERPKNERLVFENAREPKAIASQQNISSANLAEVSDGLQKTDLNSENVFYLGAPASFTSSSSHRSHPYLMRTWRRLQRLHLRQQDILNRSISDSNLEFIVQISLETSGKIQKVKVVDINALDTDSSVRAQKLISSELIALQSFGPIPEDLRSALVQSKNDPSFTMQYHLKF